MPTSTQKIAAKLAKLRAASPQNDDVPPDPTPAAKPVKRKPAHPLSSFKNAPASTHDLNKVLVEAALLSERLLKQVEALTDKLEKYERNRAEFWDEARRATRTDNGNGTFSPGMSADQIRKNISVEVAAERKKILFEAGASLDEGLGKLRDMKASADITRDLLTNPLSQIHLHTVENGKRSTYERNLASASPRSIDDTLRFAVATNNLELGAAALSRISNMTKDERRLLQLSAQDAAQLLAGDQVNRATEYLGFIDSHFSSAEIAINGLKGKGTSTAKIAAGIAKLELESVTGAIDTESEDWGE